LAPWLTRALSFLFFSTATATTEIYTLSLHDALPIFFRLMSQMSEMLSSYLSRPSSATATKPFNTSSAKTGRAARRPSTRSMLVVDRKSTRLNSSHVSISYAVFCLKKKIELGEQAGDV